MECLRRINEQTTRRDAITGTPLGGTLSTVVISCTVNVAL